jgi:hypothetical protein
VVTNPEATFDLTQLDIRETQLRIAQLESAGFVTRPELVENGRLLHCCVVAPIEHFLEMYIHWLVRDDREENVNRSQSNSTWQTQLPAYSGPANPHA